MKTLRGYQIEAIESINSWLREREDNPCCVLPTGSGKSLVIAELVKGWVERCPGFRVLVLAHRQELVSQNAAEMRSIWAGGDIGVYAAGLRKRDRRNAVIHGSIGSVCGKKFGEPFDAIIVDEAHRIPATGEGQYRRVIAAARRENPDCVVVGFTATPFRLGSGPICHRDHILNGICYEAKIGVLIDDGYLCNLRSRICDNQPELGGIRKARGDYVQGELSRVMRSGNIVEDAISEAVRVMRSEGRRKTMFFCVDVEHCREVSDALKGFGIEAPVVVAGTSSGMRANVVRKFRSGEISAVCNVGVYTEGFNVPDIDCIVLLRPTLSKSLYAQMVGRGLRIHPAKNDCIVLDFAGCIDRHGPIDLLDAGDVTLYKCGGCGYVFSKAVRKCVTCGWEIPKDVVEREEREAAERKLHSDRASQMEILASKPSAFDVEDVRVYRHKKIGKPDSVRVEYRCGVSFYNEWVLFDHELSGGGSIARMWWRRRFPGKDVPTVDEFLRDAREIERCLKEMTKTITVKRDGKYWRVIGHMIALPRLAYMETA